MYAAIVVALLAALPAPIAEMTGDRRARAVASISGDVAAVASGIAAFAATKGALATAVIVAIAASALFFVMGILSVLGGPVSLLVNVLGLAILYMAPLAFGAAAGASTAVLHGVAGALGAASWLQTAAASIVPIALAWYYGSRAIREYRRRHRPKTKGVATPRVMITLSPDEIDG